jgi:dihydroorotate dehydrogenase electron transfer subunit
MAPVYTASVPSDIDAAVVSNTRLSNDYNVVTLEAREIAELALPGQFVMIRTSPSSDPLLRRPFSIFEVVRDDGGAPVAISLLNKRVGVGTRLLYDVEPGVRLACLGPLGRPFEPVDPPVHAFMVAGGVGLAPFVTLAEALKAHGTPATLFYGARTASELFYVELFDRLGARTVLATEDGTRGLKGRVTEPLDHALKHDAAKAVSIYACGPTPMMRAVATIAARSGLACMVSLEQTMGCGLGGCYSCVVLTRTEGGAHFVRSCLEGPVFDASRIIWGALAR